MPECRIVYDKFHVMQHANAAVDEVRRAEFFRKGGRTRGVVKGKRWLLLSRWVNLDRQEAATVERSVPAEPENDESLSAEGELGPSVDLPLRGSRLRYLNAGLTSFAGSA